jgi:uncharacterized membrane protein YraQ (UPF0718 family)
MRSELKTDRTSLNDDFAGRMTQAVVKSARAMSRLLPIIVGAILLVSLINSLIPKSFYLQFFRRNMLFDSLIGSVIGSISAGSPLTSYVLGGEFLKNGVSISAVTAFLVAWVTVGMVQLPVELMALGRRFAIVRNLTAFAFAIVVGVMTMLILHIV